MKLTNMSRIFWKCIPSLGLMTLFLMSGSAWAQESPVAFQCTGEAYTVRDAPVKLFRIDQNVMPFVFVQVGGALQAPFGPGGAYISIQANNLGYDTASNLLYAVAMPVSGNFNYGVIQIDSTGAVFPFATAGLPTNVRFLAGDVSTDGTTMYINTYPSSTLYKVNLGLGTVASQALSGAGAGAVNVADWAYNPADGNLYGAVGVGPTAATGATVYQLNPDTGVISAVGQPAGLPLASSGNEQYYGGSWFNAAGHLFLYRNSDYIYEIDLAPAPPVILADFEGDAGSSTLNDAAACALGVGTINKFYTHTNNDWGLRCAVYEVDPFTGLETSECAEYRLPNINLDDDIFADPLDEDDNGFVLYGKIIRHKTVVTPGQYIAVSNIEVSVEHDVWVVEDFEECTDIGKVNPNKVPGGVQVVLIDANGDVHAIDGELASGIGGSILLEATRAVVHVEDVPADSTLRVMVKFKPSNKVEIEDSCENFEVLYDGDPRDGGVEINSASAVLTIVDKE